MRIYYMPLYFITQTRLINYNQNMPFPFLRYI